MSDYFRLTEEYQTDCNKCENRQCTIKDSYCKDRINCEMYNRLAELEDKIENGTLIELPCKVGDNIYHLSSKTICEEVVKQIKYIIDDGEIDLPNSYIMTDDNYSIDYNFYRLSKLGKSVFLTKAEAEQKLEKLLKGDK